jgi:hypothetical protein
MKVIIIGDVHCNFNAANASVLAALKQHPTAWAVIQLGDLGDGWPTPRGLERWKPNFPHPIYVVDGNHENFDALEAGDINGRLRWVRRGSTVTFNHKHNMCFGGATSPDRNSRIIGRDWWPQESITREQVQHALDWNGGPIHTMFCHERADVFPIPKTWRLPVFEENSGASDRAALSLVVKKHQPEWYFHGHWHHGDFSVINGIKVVACPHIDDSSIKWTVFDSTQIWRNWK